MFFRSDLIRSESWYTITFFLIWSDLNHDVQVLSFWSDPIWIMMYEYFLSDLIRSESWCRSTFFLIWSDLNHDVRVLSFWSDPIWIKTEPTFAINCFFIPAYKKQFWKMFKLSVSDDGLLSGTQIWLNRSRAETLLPINSLLSPQMFFSHFFPYYKITYI